MILYNTSFHVDDAFAGELLEWVADTYQPAVSAAGCFSDATFARLTTALQQGITGYCFQMFCADVKTAEDWTRDHAAPLLVELEKRCKSHVVYFTSMMEVIERYD